jgi:hypothetical protein
MSKERHMWKSTLASQSSQTDAPKERYFKVQMKAWTNFDPMEKSVGEIAQAMEQGNGFLSVIEVLEVADSLAAIADEDIRDGFENVLAAKRLVRAVSSLPAKLKEELRSALQKESGVEKSPHVVPKKAAGSAVEELGSDHRLRDSTLP